ncbi:hypothetical protein OSTOST_22681 [Ostertagia ostertagi]
MDAYHKATDNQVIRINITVLIEALCPDCQRWIVEELYPNVFKNFMNFVNIELVVRLWECQDRSKVTFDKASAKCFRTLSISDDIQRMIQYVGDKKIPFCQSEEKKKLKKVSWKY